MSGGELIRGSLTEIKRVANGLRRTKILGRTIRRWYGDQVPLRGCNVIIDTSPPSALPDITVADIFFGMYEGDELKFVRERLPRDRDVVELGASIGGVSSMIGKVLHPSRRLISVEANAELIPEAVRNVKRNAPSANVQFLHGAIDYAVTGATTQFQLGETQWSRVEAQGTNTVTVPRLTLSSILIDYNIDHYSLVCDIEGAEENLLRAESGALASCEKVIIELHPTGTMGLEGYIGEFRRLGFELQARSGRFHRGAVCVFGRPN